MLRTEPAYLRAVERFVRSGAAMIQAVTFMMLLILMSGCVDQFSTHETVIRDCDLSSSSLESIVMLPQSSETPITSLSFVSTDQTLKALHSGSSGVIETWSLESPPEFLSQVKLREVGLRGSHFNETGLYVVVASGASDYEPILDSIGSRLTGIQVWTSTGTLQDEILNDNSQTPKPRRWTDATVSPDGNLLLMGNVGSGYSLFDRGLDEGICSSIITSDGESRATTAVAFSPDGKSFAFLDASGNGTVYSIEPQRSLCRESASFQIVDEIPLQLAFRPDNSSLAVLTNKSIWLVDLSGFALGRKIMRVADNNSLLGDVLFSSDGKELLIATARGIEIRDSATGSLIAADDTLSATALAFAPTTCVMAVGALDGSIRIYKLSNPRN